MCEGGAGYAHDGRKAADRHRCQIGGAEGAQGAVGLQMLAEHRFHGGAVGQDDDDQERHQHRQGRRGGGEGGPVDG